MGVYTTKQRTGTTVYFSYMLEGSQVRERFRLTLREQEIVIYIADGQTNKEIAAALSISEHTVKEHIRHLLRKTKSSTRTAILAQIYRDS